MTAIRWLFAARLRCVWAMAVAAAIAGQPAAANVAGCAGCAKTAVLDMDSVRSCQSFSGNWGNVINCNDGWQSFQAMLESSIAETRKMQLIERKQLYRVLGEQAVQSFFRTGGKRWSFGTSAADYVVYGNITEIGYQNREFSDRSGSNRNLVGTFGVDVKFVETRTGKIFYAASIRVEETLAGSSSSADSRASVTSSLSALYGALQRKAARAIAQRLVVQAFPIRILRVTGSSAILSYGSGVLERGMLLDVMDAAGGDLVDPDTGRRIMGAGAPVATLVVTSVNPDYAVGNLRTGSASGLVTNARIAIAEETGATDDAPLVGGAWQQP